MASELDRARRDRRPVARLTSRHRGMTESDAYACQRRGIDLRIEDGEEVVGAKLGFTSKAMQDAMGVDSPNYGWLTDRMLVDGDVPMDELIHPKVEPEIAFVLDDELSGLVDAEAVIGATRSVHACLEVVDSRFEGFSFAAYDNIADNSSAGLLVMADDGVDPRDLPLDRVGAVMHVDGEVAQTGSGAAALGHPAEAVAWLVRRLHASGASLPAGSIVISGGVTAPADLIRGRRVEIEIDRVGSARLTCT